MGKGKTLGFFKFYFQKLILQFAFKLAACDEQWTAMGNERQTACFAYAPERCLHKKFAIKSTVCLMIRTKQVQMEETRRVCNDFV
jgi:hypothetical protein